MADEETPRKRTQRCCRTIGLVVRKSACAMCGCACLCCMLLIVAMSISFWLSNWIVRQAQLKGIKPSGQEFLKMMEGKNHSEMLDMLNSSEFVKAKARNEATIHPEAEKALQARRERLKREAEKAAASTQKAVEGTTEASK